MVNPPNNNAEQIPPPTGGGTVVSSTTEPIPSIPVPAAVSSIPSSTAIPASSTAPVTNSQGGPILSPVATQGQPVTPRPQGVNVSSVTPRFLSVLLLIEFYLFIGVLILFYR